MSPEHPFAWSVPIRSFFNGTRHLALMRAQLQMGTSYMCDPGAHECPLYTLSKKPATAAFHTRRMLAILHVSRSRRLHGDSGTE